MEGFSLDELKEMRKNHMKAVRIRKENEPIEYKEHLFDFDESAYKRIKMELDLIASGEVVEWIDANNVKVELTKEDLQVLLREAAVRSNNIHKEYNDVKELIYSAENEEELDTVVWD